MTDYDSLYKKQRWRNIRANQLRKSPYCESPHCQGKFVPGVVADHIEPHKGDLRKFYNTANLQTLCKPCHDGPKKSHERGGRGFNYGSDERGFPLGNKLWR